MIKFYAKSGVPQGSIFGQLLYIIYASSLQASFQNCKSHFYADDTQLYCSFKPSNALDAVNTINADLSGFARVCERHALKINATKSSVVLFANESQFTSLKETMRLYVGEDRSPFKVTFQRPHYFGYKTCLFNSQANILEPAYT